MAARSFTPSVENKEDTCQFHLALDDLRCSATRLTTVWPHRAEHNADSETVPRGTKGLRDPAHQRQVTISCRRMFSLKLAAQVSPRVNIPQRVRVSSHV